MSHECDGDCRATAEWRQQQIRDLTERLNRVRALADRWAEYADYAQNLHPDYRNRPRIYWDVAANKLRAALGDAS